MKDKAISSVQPSDRSDMVDAIYGNVFDIQRFSVHDGPGIRTIVFLKSCPLHCLWCSNPESRCAEPELIYTRSRCQRFGDCVSICPETALRLTESGIVVDRDKCILCDKCSTVCPTGALRVVGRQVSVQQVLAQVERDRPFYLHSGGGMTLSGGEPLNQPEFAIALLHGARELGLHTAVETTGWADPDVVQRVLPQADLILYDIKHMDPQRHRAGTGVDNTVILHNVRLASALGIPVIIRIPVIPGFNDDLENMLATGRFALELGVGEVHLLPYHRFGAGKYAGLGQEYALADILPPRPEQMESLRMTLVSLGIRVRLGG